MDNEKKRECDFVLTEDVINEESKDEVPKEETLQDKIDALVSILLDDLSENLDIAMNEADMLLYIQACNKAEQKEADKELMESGREGGPFYFGPFLYCDPLTHFDVSW